MMQRFIEYLRRILLAIIALTLIFLLARCIYNNRVTAYEDGNKLFLHGEAYEESFEIFDFETGTCLGRVEFENGSKYKMYEIEEKSEYIYVSMLWDHRIYKRIP